MNTLLNQMIKFCSNNATNHHHLTSHSTPCCPTTWRSNIVTRDYFTLCIMDYSYSPYFEPRRPTRISFVLHTLEQCLFGASLGIIFNPEQKIPPQKLRDHRLL